MVDDRMLPGFAQHRRLPERATASSAWGEPRPASASEDEDAVEGNSWMDWSNIIPDVGGIMAEEMEAATETASALVASVTKKASGMMASAVTDFWQPVPSPFWAPQASAAETEDVAAALGPPGGRIGGGDPTEAANHELPAMRTKPPFDIRIFFSDTGGGHRASALALEAAMKRQYGTRINVILTDFIREATPWPFCQLPEVYAATSSFPNVYKRAYDHEQDAENWRDTSTYKVSWYSCRERVLAFLLECLSQGMDLMISVHPLINHMLTDALQELYRTPVGENARRVVTVVTDLGSAHLSWFDPRVDKLFVPSDEILKLAIRRGVPEERIRLCGLPVREGFWHEDRRCKRVLREKLGLDLENDAKVVLMMCGGDGFGNVRDVAMAVGESLGHCRRSQMVVICGRNEDVQQALEEWNDMRVENKRRQVHILGFVPNVDEYMTSADILITKAGPGSIAEAMVKGLPCVLTCFVPGQEEGNISFVQDNGAGVYIPDTEPENVAERVMQWLGDSQRLFEMSANARRLARPNAALEITQRIAEELLGLELEQAKAADGSEHQCRRDKDDRLGVGPLPNS